MTYLTASDIAQRLRVSRTRVYYLAQHRGIVPAMIVGNVKLFAARDFSRFAAKAKMGRPKKVVDSIQPAA